MDHDEGADPLLFEIERTTVLGRPALGVRGELDLATAPQLAEAVDAVLAAGPRSMVVDLTGTTFMDSSGARQLAWSARRATRAGVRLQVVCPRANRPVRLVIDLLELETLVPIVETASLTEGEVGP
ncbi:STAS domain-containing protein [Geodermatophilus sp. SYSU D00708]